MTNVARCGVDTAGGGVLVPVGVRTVLVNGSPIACALDDVASHGSGPHAAATITSGAPTVLANGFPVATLTSVTSCAHPIAPGSPNVAITTF